ncbi:MAG: hypothetical protein ACKN9D_03220 [Actinomycetales bacterium]
MSNTAANAQREWRPETIRDLLTADRLTSYLDSCGHDLYRALALYEWNLAASAAVLQTTAMVEVIVRNALDTQLVAWATRRGVATWLDVIPVDTKGRADIDRARTRATKGRTALTHGKVVAELNFGFWRYLTAQRYHTSLWVPALHTAFPGGHEDLRRRRRQVDRRLENLMIVRNRAAHHEPIHRRNLDRDLDNAIEVAQWIHPEAGRWIAHTSAISAATASRP